MPIIKSAKKAARQAVKRTAQNQQIKKFIKAALKAFKADPTPENLSKAQSEYDKAAKKGLLKKNTASRRKANLVKIAKAAKTEVQETPKKTVKKATTKKPTAKKTVKTVKKVTK
ncbi:MAG: 30S ribosomal protein S20 [Candidatus Nanosyncoccus sp.]